MPVSPWLMTEYWANGIKRWCVPISALQWGCKTRSTPVGQPEEPAVMCSPLLLPGRLQQRCLCISHLTEMAGPVWLSLPDSTASHRQQELGRRVCTFSPTCQAHPKPSSAHAALNPECPTIDSPPANSCLLFKSSSCRKLPFIIQAPNAFSSLSTSTTTRTSGVKSNCLLHKFKAESTSSTYSLKFVV